MKQKVFWLWILLCSALSYAQNDLGTYEAGETVPFMVLAAEAETGEPTNAQDLRYTVFRDGAAAASGVLTPLQLGVAVGSYNTAGDDPGRYHILISGRVGDVSAQTCRAYTLVDSGRGLESIGAEVSGLNGLTPLDQVDAEAIVAAVSGSVAAVTSDVRLHADNLRRLVGERIQAVSEDVQVASRERSRSRLWYAQNTVATAERCVPADLPSHLEVQIARPGDDRFSAPIATFYHIYYYPNAATASKASRVIRSATPPEDGAFYLQPDLPW